MLELLELTLVGPNRRSDQTVIEQLFELTTDELAAFEESPAILRGKVFEAMRSVQQDFREAWFPDADAPQASAEVFAWLYSGTAVMLQKSTGHDVSEFAVLSRENAQQAHCYFEHEHGGVGKAAGKLALHLLKNAVDTLDWQPADRFQGKGIEELYAIFVDFASPRVLPADTRAIVEAAHRLDIPCIKLDRYPYGNTSGDFRIRPNSMLMLGHSRHAHLVDGTMCIDRSSAVLAIRSNRAAIFQQLSDLLPAAVHLGAAAEAGSDVDIVVSNHRLVSPLPAGRVHNSTRDIAIEASRRLDVGLLLMTINTSDPSLPLDETGGAIVNIDPAPRLDEILAPGSPGMLAAAEGFVRWVFPVGTESRIPVVAVTGTNGKTTTSRMINRIMQAAGYHTSLICTDGFTIDNQAVDPAEASQSDPWFRSFELREVELAVQETYFGRIVRAGFPYLKSDVAVCTNVTVDHIGRIGVETVEQMAEVKYSVLQRAANTAVLNFDDQHCRAMIPRLAGRRICLVSAQSGVADLEGFTSAQDMMCVLENVDGREWIVLYDQARHPVIELGEIPATHNGTALFNVYNAMCATAASHALGAGLDAIRTALSGFAMNIENTPGRLNIFEGHPFRVIMDFAHNSDGIRQIGAYLNRQEITGRKILLLAAPGDRHDVDVIETGKAAAQYFDHLVIRSYQDPRGRDRQELADHMRKFAIQGGADESMITTVPDPDEAVQAILEMGREGDWLVMTWGMGEAYKMWGEITSFQPGQK